MALPPRAITGDNGQRQFHDNRDGHVIRNAVSWCEKAPLEPTCPAPGRGSRMTVVSVRGWVGG